MHQHIQELEKQLKSLKKDAKKPSIRSGCWRCGQPGHIMRNCWVKTQNMPLNDKEAVRGARRRPMQRKWPEEIIQSV